MNADCLHNVSKYEPQGGKYVVYWMQQAQRLHDNSALNHAIKIANQLNQPLLVLFFFIPDVPEANIRHYQFMWDGIIEIATSATAHGLSFYTYKGKVLDAFALLKKDLSYVITDFGYLKWQRQLRTDVAKYLQENKIGFCSVEADVCVPVQTASIKEEYAAYSLRPKLLKLLPLYLQLDDTPQIQNKQSIRITLPDLYPAAVLDQSFLDSIAHIDKSVSPVRYLKGGYTQAIRALDTFISSKLSFYANLRSNPDREYESGLSHYLHFGMISPKTITQKVLEASAIHRDELPHLISKRNQLTEPQGSAAAFLEELIIRRELSINMCYYNNDYDSYEIVPAWAKQSLEKHRGDKRCFEYFLDTFEHADTHDIYWNCAQKELIQNGKIHGYMRMYWGKKFIEWTPDARWAYQFMSYLNNKYAIDGRDVNSYAGIAWCFGKHDRPWQERQIFGSVRYMNSAGLLRKFKLRDYLARIEGKPV